MLSSRAVLLLLSLALLAGGLALPAFANVSVSTTDGVTLTLTNSGAFSSMTVNGNTVPTLSGVSGGFFIVPMDGVTMDPDVTYLLCRYPDHRDGHPERGQRRPHRDRPEPDLLHHPLWRAALP